MKERASGGLARTIVLSHDPPDPDQKAKNRGSRGNPRFFCSEGKALTREGPLFSGALFSVRPVGDLWDAAMPPQSDAADAKRPRGQGIRWQAGRCCLAPG